MNQSDNEIIWNEMLPPTNRWKTIKIRVYITPERKKNYIKSEHGLVNERLFIAYSKHDLRSKKYVVCKQ
jgi:hypothetical protein